MKAYVFFLLLGIFTAVFLPTIASADAYCPPENPLCCPEILMPVCGVVQGAKIFDMLEYTGFNERNIVDLVVTEKSWEVLEGAFLCLPDDPDCVPCPICKDKMDFVAWQGIQLAEYRNVQILEQNLQIKQDLAITQLLVGVAIITSVVGIAVSLKRR